MGLLDKFWKNDATLTDAQEAIVDAVCAAIAFDASVEDEEWDYAIGFLVSLLDVDGEQAEALVDASFARLETMEVEALLASLSSRLPDKKQREVAVIAAAMAIAVDGEVAEEEDTYVAALAEELGFGVEEYDALLKQAANLMNEAAESAE